MPSHEHTRDHGVFVMIAAATPELALDLVLGGPNGEAIVFPIEIIASRGDLVRLVVLRVELRAELGLPQRGHRFQSSLSLLACGKL